MTLDGDIANIIKAVIESDLVAPKVPKKRVPRLKHVWKCQHPSDFLYGHRVGYYKGLAEGIVLERYRRQLSAEEDDELFKVIERYIRELRKYFAYYKDRRKRTA
ncbi:MAG: hypothetical protein M3258_03420 [Thermoproteota archaeon]|jgi:hypothetical protein|nr:hypothetical protein [Thermoproteota archaeon]